MKLSKLFISLLLVTLVVFGMSNAVEAQDFPSDTVRFIVAYDAGGSSDTLARTLKPYLEEELGTSVYVENKPGAGAQIGFTALSQAKPDGYTVGIVNLPALDLLHAARDTAFHPVDSYDPVGVNVQDPNVLMVRDDDDRFNNLQDLIDYAKENPGEVTFGADGPLSDDQTAAYKFMQATDTEISFVPYDGGAPAAKALISGEIDVAVENVFMVKKQEEKTKALCVFWNKRYHMIPDVPTFEELTGEKVINSSTRGIAAPAGVPEERLEILREAFRKAATNPEFIKDAEKRGITLIDPVKVGEEFGQVLKDTYESVDSLIPIFKEEGYIE